MFEGKPWAAYVGFAVGIVAMMAGVFGWFDPAIAWGLAGIFGFGGVAALRQYLESKGWKTYALVAINVVLSVLLALNVITPDVYAQLIAVFGGLTAVTVVQGVSKAKNGG